MDQRAHAVEEDLKQILNTRLALGEKIGLLEKRVEETVEGSKEAALAALDYVRGKAAEVIESAAYQVNPKVQASQRPWVMVGGAIAIGFVAGLVNHRRQSGVYPYYPPEADGAEVMPSHERDADAPSGVYPFYPPDHEPSTEGRASDPSPRPSREMGRSTQSFGRLRQAWRPLQFSWDELLDELAVERKRLEKAALLAGRSFIHDVARIAGEALLDQLTRSSSQRSGSSSTYR